MKRRIKRVLVAVILFLSVHGTANAQAAEVAKAIQEGVKKVIVAMDLYVQRLQNQTIQLQNIQKAVENILSKLKLEEIAGWVERQRTLYAGYFEELNRVKSIIGYYHKIRDIKDKQVRIVEQYQRAYRLFKQDDHFTADELLYMGRVYAGMLERSVQHLERLLLVVNSFTTTMTDRERMAIVDKTAEEMSETYLDLSRFNNENKLLSLRRSKDAGELAVTKALYGL